MCKILKNDATSILNYLKREDAFLREDDNNDEDFYNIERFVQHLDKTALQTVENLIGRLIKKDSMVLDLMAGWDSHIPESIKPLKVVGLGLNKKELQANRDLSYYLVQDINKKPELPFGDNSFDAVINTVSVDYITSPFSIFAEAARILKPGGIFLVIFSNRMFPEKAVKIWKEADERDRIKIVKEFFSSAGSFCNPELYISMGRPRPDDDKYASKNIPSDPIFALYSMKKGSNKDIIKASELYAAEIIPHQEYNKKKMEIKRTLCCPYCGEGLSKWEVPSDPFIEWDNDYMYICFNDACPYLIRGWKTMFEQGNSGSYRLMYVPDRDCVITVPINTLADLKGGIVIDEDSGTVR